MTDNISNCLINVNSVSTNVHWRSNFRAQDLSVVIFDIYFNELSVIWLVL